MKKSFLMAGLFATLLVFTACQQAVPDPKEMLDIKLTDIEWSEGVWKQEAEGKSTFEKYTFLSKGSMSLKLTEDSETGFFVFYEGNDSKSKVVYKYKDVTSYNYDKTHDNYGSNSSVVYDDEALTITVITEPTDTFEWSTSGKMETYYFAYYITGQNIDSLPNRKYSVKQSRDKSIITISFEATKSSGSMAMNYTFTKQ